MKIFNSVFFFYVDIYLAGVRGGAGGGARAPVFPRRRYCKRSTAMTAQSMTFTVFAFVGDI